MSNDSPAALTHGTPRTRSSLLWRAARIAAAGAVLALLGLLVWGITHGNSGSTFTDKVKRGERPVAPPFALPVIWEHTETWPASLRPGLGDGTLRLAELRGRPAVINFWASWCVPCKEEAPAFAAVARRFSGQVAFVGMDTQDFTGAARRFLRRYKVNYVSVRDGTDKTYRAYGLTGVPETYYIDPAGRTVEHAVGAVSQRELTASVKRLVKVSH